MRTTDDARTAVMALRRWGLGQPGDARHATHPGMNLNRRDRWEEAVEGLEAVLQELGEPGRWPEWPAGPEASGR